MKKDKSKFNVSQTPEGKLKRTHNGILFSSETECNYYKYLLDLQTEGKVVSIQLQPKYLLFNGYIRKSDGKKILPICYFLDFKVTYADANRIELVDVKGSPPKADCLIKRKMFEKVYPDLDLKWLAWSKQDGGWIDYSLLCKLRKERKKSKVK